MLAGVGGGMQGSQSPSTFVKYAIKFVSSANLIANSKFVEQCDKQ